MWFLRVAASWRVSTPLERQRDAKNATTWSRNENRTCTSCACWCGHTYHSGFEPMTPRGAGYNQPPTRQDAKDSVQIPTNKNLTLSVCPMHSGVKQHSKVGAWSRERFSAGPCKGMSGSCPQTPWKLSAKAFQRQGEEGVWLVVADF